MLSIITLNVIKLYVTNSRFMLSVAMLNVIMPSAVAQYKLQTKKVL
jgi:hypothetical protein